MKFFQKNQELVQPIQEKRKVRQFVDFVSGADLPEAGQRQGESKAELPGFFSYLREHWKQNASLSGQKNFFGKFQSIYLQFQEKKSQENEKLNIYESIAAGARLNREFLVLLFGSCIIATFGLFQGSTAVIIGAMLIAPLMMPILGFALGSVWGDKGLLWRSLITLLIATVLVLIISASLSLVIPGVEFNSEIMARINPNLYDILIAIASGFVGAYAYVNPRISSSISGVAIAVALMPPLCTVGISLGQMNARAASGAILLYATNLVGISLAASFVFWRLRVHPVTAQREEVSIRTARNIYLSAILLLLIAIPLGYFMFETYKEKKARESIVSIIARTIPDTEILSLQSVKFGQKIEYKLILMIPADAQEQAIAKVRKKILSILPAGGKLKITILNSSLVHDRPDANP